MEYRKEFKSEGGTEVEIRMKTECSTSGEMKEALSFMAASSRQFYLQVADKIKSTLLEVPDFRYP